MRILIFVLAIFYAVYSNAETYVDIKDNKVIITQENASGGSIKWVPIDKELFEKGEVDKIVEKVNERLNNK
jgi:hypothetical protein